MYFSHLESPFALQFFFFYFTKERISFSSPTQLFEDNQHIWASRTFDHKIYSRPWKMQRYLLWSITSMWLYPQWSDLAHNTPCAGHDIRKLLNDWNWYKLSVPSSQRPVSPLLDHSEWIRARLWSDPATVPTDRQKETAGTAERTGTLVYLTLHFNFTDDYSGPVTLTPSAFIMRSVRTLLLLLQETNASSTYNDNHYLPRDMPVISYVAVIRGLFFFWVFHGIKFHAF